MSALKDEEKETEEVESRFGSKQEFKALLLLSCFFL